MSVYHIPGIPMGGGVGVDLELCTVLQLQVDIIPS